MSNINSGMFENVADEDSSNLTTTSSNNGFYDPKQPENHNKGS